MAALSGSFNGPAVTGSVPYVAGAAVAFTLAGVWSRALVNAEASQDDGKTWTAVGVDYGLNGPPSSGAGNAVVFGAKADGGGSYSLHPPGAGLFRLRCVEFRSGWCNWTISA